MVINIHPVMCLSLTTNCRVTMVETTTGAQMGPDHVPPGSHPKVTEIVEEERTRGHLKITVVVIRVIHQIEEEAEAGPRGILVVVAAARENLLQEAANGLRDVFIFIVR